MLGNLLDSLVLGNSHLEHFAEHSGVADEVAEVVVVVVGLSFVVG